MSQSVPKVGLALSGGGAKGMAHIGVLRVLEANNIKIDYISGTSMGAIVGAMYATGYSVDQIEYYLKHVDWQALMDDDLPRNRISVLDRQTSDRYLLKFEVTDSTIVAPDAFNNGQYMLKELSFLTWQAQGQEDFSQFEIPFLCVATNLETGAEVILEQGNLAEALRASVAFPSVFSPYQIDDVLYADGGIRNNLPIAVLKQQKGMDYIIAVDVQSDLYTKDELNSFLKILDQVGSFNNALYYEEQKQYADIIIRPKGIEKFTISDYAQSSTLIKMGEEAAQQYVDVFKNWPKSNGNTNASTNLKLKEKLFISDVTVSGNTSVTKRFILSKIKFKNPKYFSPQQIEAGIDRLYGTQNFKEVFFSLEPKDTSYVLNIHVNEKETKIDLRFGLHYDDDFGLGVLANISMRNQLMANSRFNIDVVLSENPRGDLTYIYDMGFIPSLGLQFSFHKFGTAIYAQREKLTALTYQDFSVNTFITSTFADNYTVGGGVRFENVGYLEDFNTLGISNSNNNYIHYYGFLDFDSYNRTYKPLKGMKLKAEIRAISKEIDGIAFADPSSVIYLKYGQSIKFNNHFGAELQILGATTIGGQLDLPYKIYFGGLGENYSNFIFPFMGYNFMELFGEHAASVRLDVFYEVATHHFITLKANVGKMEPSLDNLISTDGLLDGYGFSYGYNSPLGPLEFTVIASSNHTDVLTYLSLGFWF